MSKPLALTLGEPAGIGPDIILTLAHLDQLPNCIVIGCAEVLDKRMAQLGMTVNIDEWQPTYQWTNKNTIALINHPTPAPVEAGQLNPDNAVQVIQCLSSAYQLIKQQQIAAIVTAPVNKGLINQAGIAFTGHTEFFQQCSQTDHVVMMLASEQLRVALLTTHIPLAQVASQVQPERINKTIKIIHKALVQRFNLAKPRIGILGLNPHAGESGYLGNEETTILQPTIDALRTEGFILSDPLSADTAFQAESLQTYDIILAMYHDQGLIPIKQNYFGKIANITLGLPFVRTSVDHGTALSIAGTGRADHQSLAYAIKMAQIMVQNSPQP